MGDAASKIADGLHFMGLKELKLKFCLLFFNPLAIGKVIENSQSPVVEECPKYCYIAVGSVFAGNGYFNWRHLWPAILSVFYSDLPIRDNRLSIFLIWKSQPFTICIRVMISIFLAKMDNS
jgi:hypothetical protein